jgi:hypothetical protein
MGGDMEGSGQMSGGLTGDEVMSGGGVVGRRMGVTVRRE